MLYGLADAVGTLEAIEARFAAARAAGGSAVLECGPVALRRQVDVWGPPRPEWKFTRDLKKTFDPAGVLNRGRYVEGI
jgi:FAD/FMN-containing dehydrogenase